MHVEPPPLLLKCTPEKARPQTISQPRRLLAEFPDRLLFLVENRNSHLGTRKLTDGHPDFTVRVGEFLPCGPLVRGISRGSECPVHVEEGFCHAFQGRCADQTLAAFDIVEDRRALPVVERTHDPASLSLSKKTCSVSPFGAVPMFVLALPSLSRNI